MQIGLIGCGNMGAGMASQLLKHKCNLTCYDTNPAAVSGLHKLGAQVAETLSEVARCSQIIILSLPKAAVVEAVVSELVSDLQAEAIVLDTSTSLPATSQAMSAVGDINNFAFVDGPVSGGSAAAYAGSMTMLLGGTSDAIKRLQPLLDILTAKAVVVGASGAGNAAKIANNMLCAANLVLVGEALRLGNAAGVAATDLLEAINAGSGRSGVSEVNFPKWVLSGKYDSGFTMGLMRKDVGLAIDLAEQLEVDLSGFASLANIWLNESGAVPDTADFNEVVKYTGSK